MDPSVSGWCLTPHCSSSLCKCSHCCGMWAAWCPGLLTLTKSPNSYRNFQSWGLITHRKTPPRDHLCVLVSQGVPGDTVYSVSSQFNNNGTSSGEESKMSHRTSSNVSSSSASLIPREVRVSCKHIMGAWYVTHILNELIRCVNEGNETVLPVVVDCIWNAKQDLSPCLPETLTTSL